MLELYDWATGCDSGSALALVGRCRGLLSAGPEASGWFEEALQRHERAERPLERARTELVFGESLRRARKRRDARGHLRLALEAFEHLGAAAWADRARAELRASGETARRRDPSTVDQLTPQELQIAGLVAARATNKEVAAKPFLSPRTIDFHLRNVFSKLAISSRRELARMELADPAGAAARSPASTQSPA